MPEIQVARATGRGCGRFLASTLADERNPANFALPIFMAHGSGDEMIPVARAEASYTALKTIGYGVEWHTYPMGHAICPEEIAAVGVWLRENTPEDALIAVHEVGAIGYFAEVGRAK